MLHLSCEETRAVVGSTIRLSGRLSDRNGTVLPLRRIVVRLDQVAVAEAQTLQNGSFTLNLPVPYVYRDAIHLVAAYGAHDADWRICSLDL